MTTTILHSDVIGTSYQHSRFDATRLRATRKFIVKSDRTDIDNERATVTTTIVGELTTTTSIDGSTYTTPLGPRYVDEDGNSGATNEIVHPDNNFLPLQTVDVQKMGDERYLVTAQYFIVPGVGGASGGTATTLQLRCEMFAKRTYKFSQLQNDEPVNYYLVPGTATDLPGNVDYVATLGEGVSPESFARIQMIPQVKFQVPFVAIDNPVLASVLTLVGCVNRSNVQLGNVTYAPYTLRFDGIQMDSYGGYETSNGQTYKFKGFYEFTARADNFTTTVATPSLTTTGDWYLREMLDGVQSDAFYDVLGEPSGDQVGLFIPGY